MIMKLKNIINTLTLAAVALVATGCQDTDAQVSIADTDAPAYVGVSPETSSAMLFGTTTIKVNFDKNIGFATKNAIQVTLNGKPVKKAWVAGISKSLSIIADVDFSRTQVLHIPAGLVTGPQGKTFDEELNLTWTIDDLPDNAAGTVTKTLGWGWNLGNHFDTSKEAIDNNWGYWDQTDILTDAPFVTLSGVGAKTMRIPVTWDAHMDEAGIIKADFFNEVAAVVDKAIAHGMNVILNTHHDAFETDLGNAVATEDDYKKDSAQIVSTWGQIAKRFASYGDQLIFETFNEVHAGDNWNAGTAEENALLNKWNQWAVNAIWAAGGNNTTRWIAVSGYAANIDQTIASLVLPDDSANRIIVAVHSYDPYSFCLAPVDADGNEAYNSWGHNADPDHSVSDFNEEAVIKQLYKLRTAYIDQGIPCYLGEYGCVVHPSDRGNAFRKYYLEFFCRAAFQAGIPMFVWDNTSDNETATGNEANCYMSHKTGNFVADGAEVIPMMIKACTSGDYSYWFDTIWTHSPAAE